MKNQTMNAEMTAALYADLINNAPTAAAKNKHIWELMKVAWSVTEGVAGGWDDLQHAIRKHMLASRADRAALVQARTALQMFHLA